MPIFWFFTTSKISGVSIYLPIEAEFDGAIIINPYDIEAITEAINLGLNMSLDERLHRWFRMIEQIQDADIHRWCQNSIKAIEKTVI